MRTTYWSAKAATIVLSYAQADQTDTIINGVGVRPPPAARWWKMRRAHKLWFAQSGNDLVVDTLGTTQQVIVKNFYAGEPLAAITATDTI